MTYLYPQPGIIAVTAIFIILTVAFFVFVPRMLRAAKADRGTSSYGMGNNEALQIGSVFALWGGLALIVAFATIVIVSAVPFNPHYWGVYEKAGTIVKITNQLGDNTSTSNSRSYTYLFHGDSTRYVLDDPRASSFKEGDAITLKCAPSWHFQAADTIDCTIRSY